MRSSLIAFVRKEFIHIFRDKRTMMILLLMPIVLIILFGYAITTEIKRVPIAILDQSRDEVTQKMISHFAASEYFDLYKMIDSEEEGQALFRQGKIRMALIVESGKLKGESEIQLLVDATDPNEATQLSAYATQIAVESGKLKVESENSNAKQLSPFTFHLSTGKGIVPIISLLYNPQMKGAYNFVPGVMGLILILICAMMTSVGIVKEKEIGTMEVLLVSPMKPVYIILAKATPYLLLSLVNIATILALSYFLLDVSINGSLLLLVGVSVLYALVALCLGLLISTIADTQQAAMLISAVVLMLPIILLSGMMFPIENMPVVLQVISNIVPAKWYIIAVKDIMIKGLGFGSVLQEVGVLVLMAVVLIGLSVKRFKIRL
ncbi:ABC transporter permease [uncultured Parabacteroides sp.]|jgi:ABC-2 type transport system permease protein|uniref:ABC transporter permease n=1 Tax=uncultured Parabacteroides sp. TaxID=512312 RepID=UPI0025D63535|nr:ABC transporter permease [uncultured Parabacteroides sp.]